MRNAVQLYIDPAVFDFANNPDALSQAFTVFKNGGSVGRRNAVPIVIVDQREG
ncbi:MAG: hypothetical protein ABR999_10615 [Methanoregula sp.]|jgi:hypothetical protein|uniref:hypothetical protein n=1 Tax=Methanoregula sp. TaxID=2052170 RepID=UPI003D0D5358